MNRFRSAVVGILVAGMHSIAAQAQDSAEVDTNCPESVRHFKAAQLYPMSCGQNHPPPASKLPTGLAAMEGVWNVRLTSESGVESWNASLSKGLSGVSHRDPNADWTLIGEFRTYPLTPVAVTSGGLITNFSDGGDDRMSVSGSALSGLLSGQWSYRDEVRVATWHKLPLPKVTSVQFHSNWTDSNGQPVVHTIDIGSDGAALAPGRIEMVHPVGCGYGRMRGNCARVYISISGENLARPIPIWLDPASHMELLNTRFHFQDTNSFSTAAAMKWIIKGEPVVESINLQFALWDGATPGRYVLWVGDQPVPFDFVIHGYPTIRPVQIETPVGAVVESFTENPPFEGTVIAPDDDETDGRQYRIILEVPRGEGSGTLKSSDSDVIEVLDETMDADSIDAGGRIQRTVIVKQAGEAELSVSWTLANGSTYSTRAGVTASPVDLKLEAVPHYAEFDVGGFIPLGGMIRAQLTVPSGKKSALAVTGGNDQIRLWLDANRQRPVALATNDAGTSEVSWGVGEAPPFVYIEGVRRSSRVREVELRLSAASGLLAWRPFQIAGWDDAMLTVTDIRLVLDGDPDLDPSQPYLIGQNSDDDDGDLLLDLYAIEIPVMLEDDLVSLSANILPQMPQTFGEVDLTIGRDLSLWTSPEKGEGKALISDLDRDQPNSIRLQRTHQNRPLYLEGVSASGSRAQLELEIRPTYLVRGTPTPVGTPMRARHDVMVVEADIDIRGVTDDQYDEEYDLGGSVSVLDDEERREDTLTRLDLRVTPDTLQSGETRLQIHSGADKVRLLRRRGISQYEALELREGDDGIASIAYASPGSLPREIFVQGLAMSEEREVEISLSYVVLQTNGLEREVASDRIRLTVWESNLTLSPILVTAFTDASRTSRSVQLSARFGVGDEDNPGIDVTAHPNTEYEWAGMGMPTYVVDRVVNKLRARLKSVANSDFGLNLAEVSIDDQGLLTVSSPGIQIIRAKHQGIPSNYSLVLAGFRLKSIDLVPGPPDYPGVPDLIEQSTLANALSGIVSDPEDAWLVIAADETGFWWDKGQVRLEEVTFEFLDGGPSISLGELLEALEPVFEKVSRVALAPSLGPNAPIVARILARGLRYKLDELFDWILNQVVSFESSEPSVAREWLVPEGGDDPDFPGIAGIIQGIRPGIADIVGTLDLGELGKKDDTVRTWVLPQIEVVDIVTEDDEVNHARPIVLDQRIEGGGSKQIWARARGRIADLAPLDFTRDFASQVPDSWRETGVVDLPVEALGQQFRVVGELVVRRSGDEEKYFVRNADLLYDVPISLLADDAWRVEHPDRVIIEDLSPANPFRKRLSAVPAAMDGITEINVTVSLPALGEASNSRGIALIAAATECEIGKAVFRLAPVEGNPDDAFEGSPYAEAIASVPGDLARLAQRASGFGPHPASSQDLPPGGPYTAGWIYAVEMPVNDAERCRLHERHDAVSSADGPAADIHSVIVQGTYHNPGASPHREALIYVGVRGWVDVRTDAKLADKVQQRFSIKDVDSDAWIATSVIAFQMMLDASDERAAFGSALRGTTPFERPGDAFDHYSAELNATNRFQSIPDPLRRP